MKRELIGSISKALADETRLRIFEAISSSGEMNCGQLVSMRGYFDAGRKGSSSTAGRNRKGLTNMAGAEGAVAESEEEV